MASQASSEHTKLVSKDSHHAQPHFLTCTTISSLYGLSLIQIYARTQQNTQITIETNMQRK